MRGTAQKIAYSVQNVGSKTNGNGLEQYGSDYIKNYNEIREK